MVTSPTAEPASLCDVQDVWMGRFAGLGVLLSVLLMLKGTLPAVGGTSSASRPFSCRDPASASAFKPLTLRPVCACTRLQPSRCGCCTSASSTWDRPGTDPPPPSPQPPSLRAILSPLTSSAPPPPCRYSFGWESQLLETGFLAVFLCPLWSLDAFKASNPVSMAVVWGYRWLLFRIMLGTTHPPQTQRTQTHKRCQAV